MANVERYEKDGEAIKEKATELEHESALAGHKALRLHFGEVFLEIAIVLASLAILARRNVFFYAGVASGLAGVLIAASSLLLG